MGSFLLRSASSVSSRELFFVGIAGLLLITMMGFVVQIHDVLETHQVRHDALYHLPFSFQSLDGFFPPLPSPLPEAGVLDEKQIRLSGSFLCASHAEGRGVAGKEQAPLRRAVEDAGIIGAYNQRVRNSSLYGSGEGGLVFFKMAGWRLKETRYPMSPVRVKGRDRVIEKVVLTPDQMLTVRKNLNDPYLLMAELASYLGLRIREVLGLMWEDFDPEARTLSIRRSAVDGIVADVKSEASRDVVPVSDEFVSLLTRWQKIAPASEVGWMFPSIVTGRPYHAGVLLRRHLRPLASKVGVPRLGWHTFRHTFRSWLDAVGTAVGV